MSKEFSSYQVASIIYDVTTKFVDDSWNPKKDIEFLSYLNNLGVLSDWEDAHGPISKTMKLKIEKNDKK